MKEFFKEVKKSVVELSFYKDVKNFEISRSLKYFFSLIFLITLILTFRFSYDFRKGLNVAADWALKNLPPIEIQKGIASVTGAEPYKIVENGFTVIIDTTGAVTSLDDYGKGILLMKNKIMYKESELKTETYSLSNIESLRIDQNFINSMRRNAVWVLFPIMLIGGFISYSIAKFIQIFLLSLITIAISSIVNVKLAYKQIFNIGVYAITTSAILGVLRAASGLQIPLFGILYIGLYIIYLIMAVLGCKEQPKAI